MLKNYQIQNLEIVNDDHTNLMETTAVIQELHAILSFQLDAVKHRIQTGNLNRECFCVLRLNSYVSLCVYVNPEMSNSPYLYAYDNQTGMLADKLWYEEALHLLDLGVQAYLETRLDKIQCVDMTRFVKEDTKQKLRALSFSYQKAEPENRER